ncbi:hypothetical protein TALC_00646 [Thermoplasmatales archaeon BRNA1]|nr:hypothetical protein TALC_00646 [Thermoplasmatales archaeon BRNA1]
MFGYTIPYYQRMSATDLGDYQRFYCETCHQLKDGYGVASTAAVNYDMTFNLIVLEALRGDAMYFDCTPKGPACVFRNPRADSDIFRSMAGYTMLLTKWELYDDMVDKPSVRTRFVDLTLSKAIAKAEERFPEYDRTVGEGFARLRELEHKECSDAVFMGREFGRYLAEPLGDIAGEDDSPDLRELFTALTSAVYVMDAVDDLEDDYTDGTFNPFLVSCDRFVNRKEYMDANMYQIAETVKQSMASLQDSYARVRKSMKGLTGVTDNIVYFGVPDSARKAIAGRGEAKLSVKNALQLRNGRTATY